MRYGTVQRIIIAAVIVGLCIGGASLSPPLAFAQKTYVRSEQLHPLYPRPQTTPNNTVYVESGVASVASNAKIEFAGGNSGTFPIIGTAGNKRIDLLTLTSAGALNRVAGTEALAA
ncbi:MAG: hypothetical protein KKH11_04210, partial [Candidatus Omnitrophica bacterium]|nr:hypothetical protein [Candidatus Omnitrophota bacterium]